MFLLPFASMDGESAPSETSIDKAELSAGALQDAGEENSRAAQKVELDLEDAPFLEDDEDEPLPMVDTAPMQGEFKVPVVEEKSEPSEKPSRKLYYIIAAAVGVILLLGIPTYMWVIPDTEVEMQEEAKVQQLEPAAEEEPVPEPVAPPEPPKEEFVIHLKPFWVEKADPDGVVRFLHMSFAFTTLAPNLEKEVQHKTPLLRDAVYYYLHNKEYEFLADTANIETVKKDLVSVLNQYIGNDQLDAVYIETYLMK